MQAGGASKISKGVVISLRKAVILKFAPNELKPFLVNIGEPAYRAKQILEWVYQKGATSFTEMTNLPKSLRDRLEQTAEIGFLEKVTEQVSVDGTAKILFGLSDGQGVETVVLPYDIGYSACISTQVGCKMGCIFCASGLPGYIRNLTAAEMMAQVLQAGESVRMRGQELKSLVLMGSGEPLDNWDATIKFLEAVRDPGRLGMSLRHVTLSTSGLVPKIQELARLGYPLTLAVSLHAPNDGLRSKIMPINKKYPLTPLLTACDEYTKATGRRVTYEYILIAGLNDSAELAEELAVRLRDRNCHVNLITLNAVPELDLRPSPEAAVRTFRDTLRQRKINVTVRRELGADIAAACGQLRNNYMREC